MWKQEAGVSVPDHFPPLYSSVLNLGRVFPSLQSEICDTVLNLFGMVYSGKDVQKAQLKWAYVKQQNSVAHTTIESRA